MKAINIALKREDGKVETDTLYGEKMFTIRDLKEISKKYNCDVIVSYIGDLVLRSEEEIQKDSLFYKRKIKKEKVEDGKTEFSEPVSEQTDSI